MQAENKDQAERRCSYPQCNCPFDAPGDPNWCARGLLPRLRSIDIEQTARPLRSVQPGHGDGPGRACAQRGPGLGRVPAGQRRRPARAAEVGARPGAHLPGRGLGDRGAAGAGRDHRMERQLMNSHMNHAPTAAALRPFGWVLTDRHGGTLAHLWRAEPVSSRLDQLRTWSDEAYPDAAPHAWTALLAVAAVPGCPNAVACADAAGCRGLEGCGPAAGTPTPRTAAIAAAIARFDAASPPVEEPAAITVWIGSNAGAPEAYAIRRPAAGVKEGS